MTDVQTAPTVQPSVFDAMPSIAPAPSNVLTRASGTALHVERDHTYILAVRSMRGTCTREEWDTPSYRRLAIARAWEHCVEALRADDEELIGFAPVALYRDQDGVVQIADITLPGKPRKLITANGTPIISAPADLAIGFRVERTTYAKWAEGPLPHLSLDMASAPTPDDDPDIQYLRHQNSALRDLIDSALAPAEWAPQANDTRADSGLVDFRIRGVIRRMELRKFDSKQGAGVSSAMIAGQMVSATDFDTPSDETSLDAILEAD